MPVTHAKFKVCRRLGEGVFAKCQTTKYALAEPKKKAAAMKNKRRRKMLTEYGTQLTEKQKVRLTYGVSEKQMVNYVKEAKKHQKDAPYIVLYDLLEHRLDNVVYRLGILPSRQASRQAVSHGHFMVNGRRVNVPSYRLKEGDQVTLRERSKNSPLYAPKDETELEKAPAWIKFDPKKVVATISKKPVFGDNETHLNFGTLIEYYSRV